MNNTNRATSLIVLLLTVLSVAPSCNAKTIGTNGKQRENSSLRDAGVVNAIRSMTRQRAAHTATLLPNGKVLVAGGFAGDEHSLASAEVFDLATGIFASAGHMSAPRAGHTATLLPNGKVLIAGGANRAEVFDASRNTFSYAAGDMETPRLFATATRLQNGQVLITGGYHGSINVSSNAWIYRA